MAHILIIEPDRILARAYMGALEATGHTVQISTTAQGGIQEADEQRPDVVLLELQLVAHSGIEFLYEFRSYADWQDIPVVIVSNVPPAEFNQSTGVLNDYLGISTYCYKPQTDLRHLAQIVKHVIPEPVNAA